ncbi:MAG: hypothetical protein ACOY2B_10505 [Pseudomonadota bacterium]
MTDILFDNVSRLLELLIVSPDGEERRGQLTLTRITRKNGDFFLHGMGVSSNQEHHFSLSDVKEIIDIDSGENVDIGEFRAELMAHQRS